MKTDIDDNERRIGLAARLSGRSSLPQKAPQPSVTRADAEIGPKYWASERRRLEAHEQAIVNEAFLRGASVKDAMGILFARTMAKTDIGDPASLYRSVTGLPGGGGIYAGRKEWYLEYWDSIEESVLADMYPYQVSEVENLRAHVVTLYNTYVALAKSEFDTLEPFVQASFEPIRTGRYADPYATATDKYRGMRGAYYRAGYINIKRDILDLIRPTTFFGVNVIGGTHQELKELLTSVEKEIRRIKPNLGNQLSAAGFVIGGFVPRFQGESDQLSNHAYGLAIDIDQSWNPQLKSPRTIKAFERATGEKVNVLLRNSSSLDAIRQTYERVAAISEKLKAWLKKWMPRYEQLQADRVKYKSDPTAKQKLVAVERELIANPDLAALSTLIDEYKKPIVQAWLAYGIVTIPAEIIELFVSLGRKNGARWGGEYEQTKDVMHLELLQLASPKSPARPHGAGRRPPVNGLDDLVRG